MFLQVTRPIDDCGHLQKQKPGKPKTGLKYQHNVNYGIRVKTDAFVLLFKNIYILYAHILVQRLNTCLVLNVHTCI